MNATAPDDAQPRVLRTAVAEGLCAVAGQRGAHRTAGGREVRARGMVQSPGDEVQLIGLLRTLA